jgi:hypothetical protein
MSWASPGPWCVILVAGLLGGLLRPSFAAGQEPMDVTRYLSGGQAKKDVPVVARSQRPDVNIQVPPPPAVGGPAPMRMENGGQPTLLSVRAWVNGKPILDQELLDDAALELLQYTSKLSEPERSARRKEILKNHLQHLIETELIVQDANRKLKDNTQALKKIKEMAERAFDKDVIKLRHNLGSEEKLKAWLAFQGMTMESFRKKKERMFMAGMYLGSRIGPIKDALGHPEIVEFYEQHMNEFQTVDRVEWQDLFLAVGPRHPTLQDARRFGEQLVAQLRAGEDFANLLHYDEGIAATNKGMGIGQTRGEIRPPEVEAYIWNMKDGEVGPPVILATGVHIFRLVKRQYAGQLPCDEKVQAQILKKLGDEVWQREQKRIVRELTARATIVVERRPLP